ncbi:MAG: type II secretion system GspH family protein [Lentisphaeraceae bacterium]|nr:type II secretion system GspH family protein [Lentisphaeraceae bacterium]
MKNAFTLLELMVVIAIISILMSILLPSLTDARMRTQSAVCKSNLKQVGIGTMSYVNDNNGYLLSSAYKNAPHNYWRKQLYNTWHGVQFTHQQNDPTLTQGVFKCPTSIDSQFKTDQSGGYGWNTQIGHFLIGNHNGKGKPVRLVALEQPTETILAGDGREGKESMNDLRLLPPSSSVNTVGTRHFFGVNLLWADMHVTYMKKPAIEAGKNGNQNYFFTVEK